MVFQHNSGNNMGSSGGGVVALAAVGLAGYGAWQMFWVAPVLTGIVVAYVVLIVVYWVLINEHYPRHEGFIKFLLVLSVLAAAGTVLFAFQVGLVRFVVGDAAVVALLVGALALGLWGVLDLFMRVVTVAVLVVLIAAPFTEQVERSEKWMVTAIVRDSACIPVAYTVEAKCQVIAAQSGDILDEKGPETTLDGGRAVFIFDGNPVGKRARCEVTSIQSGSGVGEADPTWYGAATVHIQLTKPGETPATCRTDE